MIDYLRLTDDALLRAADIHRPRGPVPYSRSRWYAEVRAGRAPQPVRIAERIVAWRWGDVREYLRRLAAEGARQ